MIQGTLKRPKCHLGRSELLSANGLTGNDGNDIADVSGNRRGRDQGEECDLGPDGDAANCNSEARTRKAALTGILLFVEACRSTLAPENAITGDCVSHSLRRENAGDDTACAFWPAEGECSRRPFRAKGLEAQFCEVIGIGSVDDGVEIADAK